MKFGRWKTAGAAEATKIWVCIAGWYGSPNFVEKQKKKEPKNECVDAQPVHPFPPPLNSMMILMKEKIEKMFDDLS